MSIPFLRRFETKILIFAFSITFFSVLVTGISITIGSRDALIKNISVRNLEIARHASGEVSIFFKDSIDEINQVAELISVFDRNRYFQQVILENVSFRMDRFNNINIIDDAGNVIVSSNLEANERIGIEKTVLKKALSGGISFSGVKLSANKLPYINLAVALNRNKKSAEILVAELNLRAIWDLVDSIKVGTNGYSFLLSSDGYLISYPDKSRIFMRYEGDISVLKEKEGIDRRGIVENLSLKGQEMLTAIVPVEGTDWYLFIQQPLSDAYLSFRYLFVYAFAIMIIALFISSAIGLLFARKLMKPVNALVEGTEKIGRGDLDARIEVSSKDEIGVLSSEFNRMAARLAESIEALKESENKYRLLVENVSDMIFSMDLKGNFLFLSNNVKGILGYEAGELVGKNIVNYITRECRDKFFAELEREEPGSIGLKEFECSFITKEEERRVLDIRLVMAEGFGNTGDEYVYYGTARDVTEKKELQNRLLQSEKLSLMGEIISEVTHELNNPLTGIMGFSELLLLDGNLTEEARGDVKKILEETERASKIIKNFLTFSRRYEPQKKSCDINQILESVLEIRAYDMNVSNIKVVRKMDRRIPATMADPNQLRQVFLNLVSNAIYSMKESGGEGILAIETKRDGDKIVISVSDTGKGISKRNISKIFKAFFTTKDAGKGTGLGLAISKSIIEEHGGHINVESAPGKGATFYVELPLEKAVETDRGPEEKEESKELKNLRILVVDDEQTILDFISMIFAKEGSAIDKAKNGRRAIEYLLSNDYDIVISDFKMPGMNGFELYGWIKENKPHLLEKIIFVTGDILNQEVQMFFQKTGVFHINKPFGFNELKKIISEIIES